MRIALRIFLSYLLLSLLLGGATLLAAYWSVEKLVTGVTSAMAIEMSRELGLFLTATGRGNLDDMTPAQAERLAAQIRDYAARSERIETVVIVDRDCRIRFASDPKVVGLVFKDEAERALLLSDTPTVREVPRGESSWLTEITVPITSLGGGRIGSLRLLVIPQYFAEYLDAPRQAALWIFAGMIVFITASGVVLASLMTRPVRRLNRTLLELQKRGGAARVEFEDEPDFAPALMVVRGLGERLEKLAASSRSSELILSTITQALEQGVLIADAAGRVITVNDVALRMLGAPSGERHAEAGGPEDQGSLIATRLVESNPELAGLIQAAATGHSASLDVPVRAGDAAHGGVRITSHVLREGDRVAGTLLLMRDLESLQALESHLQEAGRLSLLARLTSTVAHEIKNPLNSMVINLEALRSLGESIPYETRMEFEETVDLMVREIYHLDEVIRDYLGLAAAGEREPAGTDVRDVIERVASLIRYEANQSKVRVESVVTPDLPLVQVPAVRLKQALLNLCLNAVQAMGEGGRLTVRARPWGPGVSIEVEDTGPGIPEENRREIFDFHFTTKEGGSGLGLPITRMIVEAAGGSVELDSEPGRGTKFRLRLPATRDAAHSVG